MRWHTGIPAKSWDTHLFAHHGHFLQSSHWGAFNQSLGKLVFYAQGDGWQCLAVLEKSRTGTRLYCPYGPLSDDEDSFVEALDALLALARQHKAVFVRMEPILTQQRVSLSDFKLRRALKDIQPLQTMTLDLNQSVDEILLGFTPTNRNLYRTAGKKGLKIRSSHDPKDIAIFLQMTKDVAQHTGIRPHSDHYYTTMAKVLLPRKAGKLYIAEHDGKPVGAAFVFDSPTTRYYAHAGNLVSARKLHPGSPLLATLIFDAKKQGQTTFDFVGAAPVGIKNHPWEGFTKFKASFGGVYKFYNGTWELPTRGLYHIYRGVYEAHKTLWTR